MNKLVIDASTLLRATLNQRSNTYSRLKPLFKQVDTQIISIPLMYYEYANGVRSSLSDPDAAATLTTKMSHLPIRIFDFKSNHLSQTLRLAFQLKTTIYDTAYHYVAILLNGTFITCDKDYYSKASHLKHIELW